MKFIRNGIRCWVFGLLALSCSATYAQAPKEFSLYLKLNAEMFKNLASEDPESIKEFAAEHPGIKLEELKDVKTVVADAVATVLKKPDAFSTVILYHAASRAFGEHYRLSQEHRRGRRFLVLSAIADKHLEDSAFLFYAAQLRARFDAKCFPPAGEGGNSPLVLFAALSQTIGSVINPAITDRPKLLEKALERVTKWSPKAPADYHPGYEFTERQTELAAQEAVKEDREDFLSHMTGFCTLLNIPEYLVAKRILRAYNQGTDGKRPSDETADQATGTIIRLEKEKGINVLTDSLQKAVDPLPNPFDKSDGSQ